MSKVYMRIKKEINNDIIILTISKRMVNDQSTLKLYPYVKDLIDNGQRKIVVDMGKVRFFSSNGLASLLASYASLNKVEGDLRIVQPSSRIRNLLKYTQVDKIFKIYASVENAIDSYS